MNNVCRNCGKLLGEKEYICQNCFEIIDLKKHEEVVDERVATIGKVERKQKAGHVKCNKCGENVKIGVPACKRCEHVLNEELFKDFANVTRQGLDNRNVTKHSKGLQFACFLIPLFGIFMWLKYRKKDQTLASLCISNWWAGFGRARLIVIVLVYVFYLFLFK